VTKFSGEDEESRPGCISNHTALYYEERDEMVVFGGNDRIKQLWTNEVYILNLGSITWRRIDVGGDEFDEHQNGGSEGPSSQSPLPPERFPKGRCGHTATWINYPRRNDKSMIIFGGTTQVHRLNDTWIFSMKDESWQKVEAKGNIPPPLNNHASVACHSNLYIFGGFPHNKHLYQLNLETRVWKIIHLNSTGDASGPCSRFGHTLNLIPNRASPNAEHPSMLLYGGVDERRNTLCDIYEFQAAEELKYNLAQKEVQETFFELQFKFIPLLLSSQIQKFIVQQQFSHESEIVTTIVGKLASFQLRPSIRDSSNKQKPILIKKLAESVSEFKRLNQSAKFHTPQQKQLAASLQTLIAEYVAQHSKLKHQSLINANHELLTFYNRAQCKLSELLLRYLLVVLNKGQINKRIPTSVRISTHMISSEAINLGRESFHLLVSASKTVYKMVSAIISNDLTSYHSTSGMIDLSTRVSAIEILSECVARNLTIRYTEQILCLSSSLSKPATIEDNDSSAANKLSTSSTDPDNTIVHATDSEEDPMSEIHSVGRGVESVYSTQSVNLNPPGGCEILADCAVKHILYFLESDAHQERMVFSDNIREIADEFLEVVFRGGALTDFNQDLDPTPIETNPKLNIPSQWTDVGIFRMSGIKIDDSQCFASENQTKYCGAPHIYRFRTGSLEEVDELGLTKVDPKSSSFIESVPSHAKWSGSSDSDRMRGLIDDLKLENAQLRREQDRLLDMKRDFEQFVEKVNADKQVESAFREEEKRRHMQHRVDLSKKERKFQQTIEERELEVKTLKGKIHHLEQEITALKGQHQQSERYNRELVERVNDLRALEDENRKHKKEIETLLHYKTRVEGKRKLLPGKVRTLEDSVQSLKAAIRESKKLDYDELAQQLKDMKRELAQKRLEIVEQTREFQEYRKKAQQEKEELEGKLFQYAQQAGHSKKATENVEENLKLELQSVRETMNIKIGSLEKELNEKQGLLDRFTIERAKMVTTEQTLRDELDELREALAGNEELNKQREAIKEQEAQKHQLTSRIAELEHEIGQCRDQLTEKTQQEYVSHGEVEQLQQENQSLLERIEKLKSLQKDNKDLRARLADVNQVQKGSTDSHARIQAENIELKIEVKKMTELIVTLQNRLAKAVNSGS